MRLSLILASTALTAATSFAAHAAEPLETYGFAFGGFATVQDPTFSGIVGGSPETVETFFDNEGYSLGFGVGASLSQWAPGLRGEIELSYTSGDINNTNFSGNGPAQEAANGSIDTTRLLATVYKDFENGSAFTPYIGAGLGLASSDLGISYGPGVTLNDTDRGLAAQLVIGGSYKVNERFDLTGDVRFIRDFDVESQRLSPLGALTGTVSSDVDTVAVNFGIRYKF